MDFNGGTSPSAPVGTPPEPQPPLSPPVSPPLTPLSDISTTPASFSPSLESVSPPTVPANPPATLNEPTPLPSPDAVATPPPVLPPHSKKKKGGMVKKVLLSLLVLILIAGAGGGGYYYGYMQGKLKGNQEASADYQAQLAAKQKADNATSKDTTDDTTTTSKLVLGDLKTPTYADETLNGTVGRQVEANDGLVLMVTDVERNYQTTDPNYKLDTGKELVKVNFLVGNITKDKEKDLSNFSFHLVTSNGTQLSPETIASYENKFDTLKLASGSQSKASIVYKVTKDDKPLTFTREQKYSLGAQQNKVVTTKIVIAL